MVDPDAPSPSEPRYREWLHWYSNITAEFIFKIINTINRYLTVTGFLITKCRIVVDIPEGSDATKGIFKLHTASFFLFFFSPKKLDVQYRNIVNSK